MKLIDEIISEHTISGAERYENRIGNLPGLKPPEWINEGPLYEVFLRTCPPEYNFRSLQKRIPDLKELGIKTIWLMPIHPIGKIKRKGTCGSPYAVKDFFGINPDYGTVTDFQALICEIHHYQMKIIIDLVANHGAKDHKMLQDQPDMIKQARSRLAVPWTDIHEFNYKNRKIRDYMLEVMQYWVGEYDIDGFRCDSAGLIPLNFWEEATQQLTRLKKDLFMLAEWEGAALHQKVFHSTYDWTLYALLVDIYQMKRPTGDIIRLIEEKRTGYPRHSLPLRFTENHDFQRTVEQFGETSFYPYVALIYMIYGIPLIYAGQEYGARIRPSLFERPLENDSEYNSEIFAFYRRLIHQRQNSAALRCRQLNVAQMKIPDRVLAFEKLVKDETVLVLLNFSNDRFSVTIPDQYTYSEVIDLKNGHQLQIVDSVHIDSFGVYLIKKQSEGIS
jgi:glycosidase